MSLLVGAERRRVLRQLLRSLPPTVTRFALVEAAPGEREHELMDLVAEAARGGQGVKLFDYTAGPECGFHLWEQLLGELPAASTWPARRKAIVRQVDELAKRCPVVLLIRGIESLDADSLAVLEPLMRLQIPLQIVATCAHGAALNLPAQKVERYVIGSLTEEDVAERLTTSTLARRLQRETDGSWAALERWIAQRAPESKATELPESAGECLALISELPLATPERLEEILERSVGSDLETLHTKGWIIKSGEAICLARRDSDLLEYAVSASSLVRCGDKLAAWPVAALRCYLRARAQEGVESVWQPAIDALVTEGALASAVEHLKDVLELATPAERERAWTQLIELQVAMGRIGEAASQARRRFSQQDDTSSLLVLARLLIASGEYEEVEQALRSRWSESESLRGAWAEVCYQLGRRDECQTHLDALLEGQLDPETELSVLQTQAKLDLGKGCDPRLAYERYEQRAQALGHPEHIALSLGGQGVAHLRLREHEQAEQKLQSAYRKAEAAGSLKGRALASHNLAVLSHLRHRYEEARSRYEEALGFLRSLGHRTSLARCAFNLGDLYETLGCYERGRSMADLGAQLGGSGLGPAARAEGMLLRGRVELGRNEHAAAAVAFEAALAEMRVSDPQRSVAALLGLARVALAEGDAAKALRLLDESASVDVPATRLGEIWLARAAVERELLGGLGRELPLAQEGLSLVADRDPHLELEAMLMVARALMEQGDASAAQTLVARAAKLEAWLEQHVPDDLRTSFHQRPARRLLDQLRGLRQSRMPHTGIIGESAAIQRTLEIVERVAPSPCTVLIQGESGTGKELIAEAIHRASSRRRGPLVRVNCAALVEGLLMSELFGHEKGAFTGATALRRGRFELAHGGTLFLDEIGDVSPRVQAALLRVLQERQFERVGGTETIRVDVRIVAATHRDLASMVESGAFRDDLYYRLHEVAVVVPPLRERPTDIPMLAQYILGRLGERGAGSLHLSRAAMDKLVAYDWPGNVRQLENVLQAASLFATASRIEATDLSIPSSSAPPPVDELGQVYDQLRAGELSMRDLKKEIERQCIARALRDCDGNITQAASLLGMKRPRLSQLVKEYGLRSVETDS